MSNIKKFTARICLYFNNNIYKLFSLGFYRDGGYFITDLYEREGYKYLASKVRAKQGELRELIKINFDKDNTYTFKVSRPKISHHGDGNAHISGPGIISGYNQDGTPKGLHVKSFKKNELNDGGPIFTFNVGRKTLDYFPKISREDLDKIFRLRKEPHTIFNQIGMLDITNGNENYCFTIEGYYIHKSQIPDDYIHGSFLHKPHPLYGNLPLIPIASPLEAPYVIGIGIIKDALGEADDLFHYGGAPGHIQGGERDTLDLMSLPEDSEAFRDLTYNP